VITAVDTNVLRDFFTADPTFSDVSTAALRMALQEGQLVSCDIVWAESCAAFPSSESATDAMRRLGVVFSPVDAETAGAAGDAWRSYRRHGGKRDRLLADFLIGAHTMRRADRLLTRDRAFYRTYFKRLSVLDPTSSRHR